ncbi:MAG: OmpA family protein [Holophaga sp.]|nr:OmpA family protein [Holophaga sp.]
MRFAKGSGLLGLVAFAVIAGPVAQAQDAGWYAGANIGRSKAKIDDPAITNGLLGQGFSSVAIDDHDRNTGFKIFGGYQFNRYLSLEGGYFNLGHFNFTATTVPTGTLNGDIRIQGLNLDPVFTLPITEKFSAFARVGLTYAQAKDSFNGSRFVQVQDSGPKQETFNAKFGGGLQYDFTRSVGMRVEAERYRISDAVGNRGDVDLFSVGVVARFGRHAPAASQAAAPPPAAVEAPVLVIVPVPTPTQQYCTILDLEFAIDTDDIRKEDKEKLAVLGTYLAKYPETSAVIEGHSDNVGTSEHNQLLSQRRAESVVKYLVTDLHIDPARLSAKGYGETRPVADNSTEEGKRKNRRVDAVVACVTDVQGLTVAPARMTLALYIDFDQQKADVKPEYDGELRKVANLLKANPTISATVEGHTGNLQATQAQAVEISRRRAQNVVDYLVNNFGIERSRLTARGYGDARRFAYNTSAEGEQENRRVNIIFTYPN